MSRGVSFCSFCHSHRQAFYSSASSAWSPFRSNLYYCSHDISRRTLSSRIMTSKFQQQEPPLFSSVCKAAANGVSSETCSPNQQRKFSSNGTAETQTLNMKTLNPNILHVEYAVRGPLVIRACELEKELSQVGLLTYLPNLFQVAFCPTQGWETPNMYVLCEIT